MPVTGPKKGASTVQLKGSNRSPKDANRVPSVTLLSYGAKCAKWLSKKQMCRSRAGLSTGFSTVPVDCPKGSRELRVSLVFPLPGRAAEKRG
jgi:hypothetical protein